MDSSRNIIWLASYPKSGNTWFRAFITALLHENQEVDINKLVAFSYADREWFDTKSGIDSSDLSFQELNKLRVRLLEWVSKRRNDYVFIKTHDMLFHNDQGQEPIIPLSVTKAVIYFIRNPLDLAVSYAYHNGHADFEQSVNWICDEDHGLCFREDKQLFLLPEKLGSWSSHIKNWVEQSIVPVSLLRYEDMLNDTFNTFFGIADKIISDIEEKDVLKAIENTRLKKLQKQEKTDGFIDKSVVTKQFFREGGLGSWRSKLTEKQVNKIINKNYDMMKKMNYLDANDQPVF